MSLTGQAHNHICSRTAITVAVGKEPQFTTILAPLSKEEARDTTALHITTCAEAIGFIGTMDELLDFATAMEHQVYMWAIKNGHSDWIGQRHERTEKEGARFGDGHKQHG